MPGTAPTKWVYGITNYIFDIHARIYIEGSRKKKKIKNTRSTNNIKHVINKIVEFRLSNNDLYVLTYFITIIIRRNISAGDWYYIIPPPIAAVDDESQRSTAVHNNVIKRHIIILPVYNGAK